MTKIDRIYQELDDGDVSYVNADFYYVVLNNKKSIECVFRQNDIWPMYKRSGRTTHH